MGQIRSWWRIIRSIGPGAKAGRNADRLFRFYLIGALDEIGVFRYLEQPRAYGEILAEFGLIDGDYTREVLQLLASDRRNVIVFADGRYTLNPKVPRPAYDELVAVTPKHIQPFISLAEGLKDSIIDRLRGERVGVTEMFERGEVSLSDRFNTLLGAGSYSAIRAAVFDNLPRADFDWLHGKRLLEMGCGNGLETAEIWLRFQGDIHITAIDRVPKMVGLARINFGPTLDRLAPDHPPVTDENRPLFEEGNAMELKYPDGTFDAVFSSIMLHWTFDPRQAIRESIRVVRPGGLILGAQATKPLVNPFFDLVIRSQRDSHGFFWAEEYKRWYRDAGVSVRPVTPAGIIGVRKPDLEGSSNG
ncbi:MAG: methyltransferase domain-containing protein [Chloroflexi bacterium]|nr:methyltransferase domain-containing protein [Chloroflexota bacterium]